MFTQCNPYHVIKLPPNLDPPTNSGVERSPDPKQNECRIPNAEGAVDDADEEVGECFL